ncbi:MAG: CHAD domain-containing protein [Balneolaceae bacterium]|nr:MAG: CHAD domain-containing protein [Balneolaceae bacterium]
MKSALANKRYSFVVKKSDSLIVGIRKSLSNQLEKVLFLASEYDTNPETAIHEIRKAFKRMRSVTTLLMPFIPDLSKSWNHFWRDYSRTLSDARVMCVRVNSIRVFSDEAHGNYKSLLNLAVASRNLMLHSVKKNGVIDELAAGMEESKRKLIELVPADLELFDLEKGLIKTYEKAKKQLDKSLFSDNPEDLHELRKRCKVIQYHTELMSGRSPELKALNRKISRNTELLGQYNDMNDLESWGNSTPGVSASDEWCLLLEQIEGEKADLRKKALYNITQLLKGDGTDYLEFYTELHFDLNEQKNSI